MNKLAHVLNSASNSIMFIQIIEDDFGSVVGER